MGGKIIDLSEYKSSGKNQSRRANREHSARERLDPEAQILMNISDEIDAIIINHLTAGDVEARDLAGLLSHRLGSLMRHIEGKEKLWDVCEKVLKKQAAIK